VAYRVLLPEATAGVAMWCYWPAVTAKAWKSNCGVQACCWRGGQCCANTCVLRNSAQSLRARGRQCHLLEHQLWRGIACQGFEQGCAADSMGKHNQACVVIPSLPLSAGRCGVSGTQVSSSRCSISGMHCSGIQAAFQGQSCVVLPCVGLGLAWSDVVTLCHGHCAVRSMFRGCRHLEQDEPFTLDSRHLRSVSVVKDFAALHSLFVGQPPCACPAVCCACPGISRCVGISRYGHTGRPACWMPSRCISTFVELW
jgi:hypothetical protein